MGKHSKHHRKRRGRRNARHRPPPGAAPGLIAIPPDSPRPVIRMMAFGPEQYIERELAEPAQIKEYLGKWAVIWINVDGLGDADVLQAIGEVFELHPLAIADVAHVHQRPKIEHFGDNMFILMQMQTPDAEERSEQVSVFLGRDYVLSFQERAGDCFDTIRDRIRHDTGRVRRAGNDYMAYLLLDAVVDGYYPVLDQISDRIDDLEDAVMLNPQPGSARAIHDVKQELLHLRRDIWPQREAISTLLRDESPLISAETRPYLRDCYDHAIQIMDMSETFRELASGLMDAYLSSVNNRMSEVMKVLTMIATIFIPLTFVVGIYGMNFQHMPELSWRWAYPVVLLTMAAMAAGMLLFFRRRKWIGPGSHFAPAKHDEPPEG